jgi:epoxyqueuosine reductase
MSERVGAEQLKEQAFVLGFQSVGVAPAVQPPHLEAYREWLGKGFGASMAYLSEQLPLKEHPDRLLPGAKSVIAVTLNYNQPSLQSTGSPRIAKYALGRDYHKVLRGKLRKLGAWVQSEYPGSKCRPCVDSAPVMERDFANLAGLGFFGKNTMLIDPKRGSWFFIGLLLTTANFEPDQPFEGGCGSCTKCIDACPTGAIVYEDQRWQLNADRCISYLTIEHRGEIDPDHARKMGDWTFGCDVCQDVCPFNQPRENNPERGLKTEEPDFQQLRTWPNLEELSQISAEDWDELTRGTAIRRTGHEGIKRNAKINLANQ